jgi:hypothetical protein
MAYINRIAIVAFFTILVSCAIPQQQKLATPSGNPEIIISNVTRKAVIDRLIEAKLQMGMQLKSVSDYSVVFGQKADTSNFMASLAYGSRYDPTPEARITYNVVEIANGVRVFSRLEVVTNPGSGFERVSDRTQSYAQKMQNELVQLRASFY